jgi:segregation and condensation protein A
LQRDSSDGSMTLQQMFVGRTKRTEMIGLFLATLELVRQKRVKVVQAEPGGEIRLKLRPPEEQLRAEDDKPTDWHDPVTGEVQYDWPSEEARKQAESRAQRRIERMKNRQFGGDALGEEDDIIDVDGDDDAQEFVTDADGTANDPV